MPELTPDQMIFWKTEQLKKRYMKQGMTKKQALEQVKADLVKQFPSDYVIGIENDHIVIRHTYSIVDNGKTVASGLQKWLDRDKIDTENMGKTLSNVFGGAGNALKMLENLKKGFNNAVGNKEETNDRRSGTDDEGSTER